MTKLTIEIGATTYATAFTYAGTDQDNNVFATSGTEKFLVSNHSFTDTQTLPTPYAHRSTANYVACFLTGTHVGSLRGDIAVEDIVAGDLLSTADGRAVAVKWVGRQAVAVIFDRVEERAPICIEAGALGPGLPGRDLRLTADHALLLDGVLVQAGALVNGTTIRRMTRAETGDVYTVWHIETEGHQMILAEGCAAETFVDTVSRRRFDNYAEYAAAFGQEDATIVESDLPRVKSARQLPAALRDLIAVRRAA